MGRLLNLGSLCIDQVYRVPQLSGAGETVASVSHQTFPGGKGLNQSLAAARAGASVAHFGCIGGDGGMLLSVLKEAGVDVSGVREIATAQSGHAVIQVNDAGENSIVIAGGANRLLEPGDVTRALSAASDSDWLLLQNEINDLPAVLAAVEQCPASVAFNVAPADAACAEYDLTGVDLLIVNEHEAAVMGGDQQADQQADSRRNLARLAGQYPQMTVVLTLGAEGLLYQQPDQETQFLPAISVHAVDETAAGDAFIGFLISGLLRGQTLSDALKEGSAAGALAVTLEGAATSVPRREEVLTLLKETSAR